MPIIVEYSWLMNSWMVELSCCWRFFVFTKGQGNNLECYGVFLSSCNCLLCASRSEKVYDAGRLVGPSFTVGLRQETTVGLQVQGRLLANRRRKLQSQTFLGEHFCSLKYDEVRITAVACQRWLGTGPLGQVVIMQAFHHAARARPFSCFRILSMMLPWQHVTLVSCGWDHSVFGFHYDLKSWTPESQGKPKEMTKLVRPDVQGLTTSSRYS